MKRIMITAGVLLLCVVVFGQGRKREVKVSPFYQDSMYHRIAPVDLNTPSSDVSSMFYKGNLYFMSTRCEDRFGSMVCYTDRRTGEPYYTLFYSSRKDTASFDMVKPYGYELLSKFNDGPICITPDGKTLYLTRNVLKKADANLNRRTKEHIFVLQIFQYQYNSSKNRWENEKAFPYNNKSYSCGYAFINPAGDRLYFSSDMPGGYGGMDLYVCELQGNVWGEPKNMGKYINTPGNEIYPSLDQSGEKLYFASDGLKGMGGYDIYVAEPFADKSQEPKNMGFPVNGEYDDMGLVYYENDNRGYFTSNRPLEMKVDGKTIMDRSDNIYYLFSNIPPVQTYQLIVLDSITQKPLVSKVVFIRDGKSDKPTELISAITEKEVELVPRNEYKVNYSVGNFGVKSITMTPTKEQTKIVLHYHLPIKLAGTVRNRSGKTINGADVLVIANDGKEYEVESNNQGNFEVDGLIAGQSYRIEVRGNGYETAYDGVSIPDNIEELEATYSREVMLSPVKKFIMPDNILFDVGKYDLKQAALVELDKLAEMLTDNSNLSVEVGAHTDSRGSAALNNKLSVQRAKSVVDYLVYKGIDSKRIKSKGYGFSRLINRCKKGVNCSEEEHAANRRVEFTFSEKVTKPASKAKKK